MGQCALAREHTDHHWERDCGPLPACGPCGLRSDDREVLTDLSVQCARELSTQVPNFYVGRWTEPTNTISLTIGADGEFVYQFGTISTRRMVRGWREPPETSVLVWSIFGSRGQYKLESISEDAIYLDGVIPLFRDKAWEEKLLKSGRKVTHDTNVFSSPRKSKGSWTRGCSLPMPGSLPEFPVQFPVGR